MVGRKREFTRSDALMVLPSLSTATVACDTILLSGKKKSGKKNVVRKQCCQEKTMCCQEKPHVAKGTTLSKNNVYLVARICWRCVSCVPSIALARWTGEAAPHWHRRWPGGGSPGVVATPEKRKSGTCFHQTPESSNGSAGWNGKQHRKQRAGNNTGNMGQYSRKWCGGSRWWRGGCVSGCVSWSWRGRGPPRLPRCPRLSGE